MARPGWQACRAPATQSASLVCLHASASSGGQWQVLQRRLNGRYQVLSPDLYGSGNSPPWPAERELTLAEDVALLEPVFETAGGAVHLIGHSYGGAIAVRAALTYPGRFLSLVLIEPVLFGLLLAEDPGQPAASEIVALCQHTRVTVELGALDSAARRFIDYWMGPLADVAGPVARRMMVWARTGAWMKSPMIGIRQGPPGAGGGLEHRMVAVRRAR